MCNRGLFVYWFFFFQAEDGIRVVERSRGLGDVYKGEGWGCGRGGLLAVREASLRAGGVTVRVGVTVA